MHYDTDVQSVDESFELLEDVAEDVEPYRPDVAAAVRMVVDDIQRGEKELELDDDLPLPFADEEDQMVFGVGMYVGALLQEAENQYEPDGEHVDAARAVNEERADGAR